jgi:hypothetical protein
MLSKCANPECVEVFRYLHQGRIFHFHAPAADAPKGAPTWALHERFWLCEQCSKKLTLVWCGTQIKLTPLPHGSRQEIMGTTDRTLLRGRKHRRASAAGRDDV